MVCAFSIEIIMPDGSDCKDHWTLSGWSSHWDVLACIVLASHEFKADKVSDSGYFEKWIDQLTHSSSSCSGWMSLRYPIWSKRRIFGSIILRVKKISGENFSVNGLCESIWIFLLTCLTPAICRHIILQTFSESPFVISRIHYEGLMKATMTRRISTPTIIWP